MCSRLGTNSCAPIPIAMFDTALAVVGVAGAEEAADRPPGTNTAALAAESAVNVGLLRGEEHELTRKI